jgi:hypothetical protein
MDTSTNLIPPIQILMNSTTFLNIGNLLKNQKSHTLGTTEPKIDPKIVKEQQV